MNYDPNIRTPTIGFHSFLKKNNPKTAVNKGKMNYEHFLKSIELISAKLYPDYSLEMGV